MDNPLVYAMKKSGISAIELSRNLGVSRQYISRLERGCAVNLSNSLINWIINQIEEDFEEITKEGVSNWYIIWKTTKRLSVLSLRNIELPNLKEVGTHPVVDLMTRGSIEDFLKRISSISDINNSLSREDFIKWRSSHWDSTYKFATDMCLTPAAVDSYEKGLTRRLNPEINEFFNWVKEYSPVAKEQNV